MSRGMEWRKFKSKSPRGDILGKVKMEVVKEKVNKPEKHRVNFSGS